jgi:uncharacterized membrane protein YgcG
MNATGTPLLVTSDVYDVAQLAGGLPRVVDTAVVILLERGRLKVDEDGRLQAAGTAVHPVEAAVLALVGPRPRCTAAALRTRAPGEPRLTGVAERLVADGLLRRNPLAGLSSSWPAHLRTAAGRRVLEEWRTAPPAGGSSVGVALGGPLRMADRVLCDTVFAPVPASPARRAGRRADAVAADSGSSGWVFSGWGGDGGGGGWGGGDSGGCGGGDGGGGC